MTVKGPKGRMTKPLVTKYNVGDVVKLTRAQDPKTIVGRHGERQPYVGDLGVIRKIVIADPNDGDETRLMFYVRFAEWGRTASLHQTEFKRVLVNETRRREAIYPEDEQWLRRQLGGLDGPRG